MVAVGGLGSLKGTLRRRARCSAFSTPPANICCADAGGFFIYAVAIAILLIKPAGLYGRE